MKTKTLGGSVVFAIKWFENSKEHVWIEAGGRSGKFMTFVNLRNLEDWPEIEKVLNQRKKSGDKMQDTTPTYLTDCADLPTKKEIDMSEPEPKAEPKIEQKTIKKSANPNKEKELNNTNTVKRRGRPKGSKNKNLI